MGSDEGNGIHTLNVEPQMIYYSVLQTEGLGGRGRWWAGKTLLVELAGRTPKATVQN